MIDKPLAKLNKDVEIIQINRIRDERETPHLTPKKFRESCDML